MCRTGAMTVRTPLGRGEDAWTLSGTVSWRMVGTKRRLGLLPAHCSQSPGGRRRGPRGSSGCSFLAYSSWFPWKSPFPPGEVRPRQARVQQVFKGRKESQLKGTWGSSSLYAYYTDRKTEAQRGIDWSQRELGQSLDESPGLQHPGPDLDLGRWSKGALGAVIETVGPAAEGEGPGRTVGVALPSIPSVQPGSLWGPISGLL